MLALIYLVGCESDPTNPGDGGSDTDSGDGSGVLTIPSSPTMIGATSVSNRQIKIRWEIDDTVKRTGFRITFIQRGDSTDFVDVPHPDSLEYTFGTLTQGSLYTLEVRTVNDTLFSEPSEQVTWSPARRYDEGQRIYEPASEYQHAQGMGLPDRWGGPGRNIKYPDGWDVCLDSVDGRWRIGSPRASVYINENDPTVFKSGFFSRSAPIGMIWQNISSLDEAFGLKPLNADAMTEKMIDFTEFDSRGESFAFAVYTREQSYARVFVKARDGRILQGEYPNRYVELVVSMQSKRDVPYASFGR